MNWSNLCILNITNYNKAYDAPYQSSYAEEGTKHLVLAKLVPSSSKTEQIRKYPQEIALLETAHSGTGMGRPRIAQIIFLIFCMRTAFITAK